MPGNIPPPSDPHCFFFPARESKSLPTMQNFQNKEKNTIPYDAVAMLLQTKKKASWLCDFLIIKVILKYEF